MRNFSVIKCGRLCWRSFVFALVAYVPECPSYYSEPLATYNTEQLYGLQLRRTHKHMSHDLLSRSLLSNSSQSPFHIFLGSYYRGPLHIIDYMRGRIGLPCKLCGK